MIGLGGGFKTSTQKNSLSLLIYATLKSQIFVRIINYDNLCKFCHNNNLGIRLIKVENRTIWFSLTPDERNIIDIL